MNKDITICFRTSTKLKKTLESIARSNRWSLSSTVENILADYIDRVAVPEMEQERRISLRRDVMLPVLITRTGEKDTPYTGMVNDISEGGLRISLPKTSNIDVGQDNKNVPLDLTMNLPGQSNPVTVRCTPLRSQKDEEKMEMGVTITGIDSDGYRKLLAFLRESDT